jgi:predicted nucleotidyltransferase
MGLWQSARWTKASSSRPSAPMKLELKAAGIVHLHLHGSVVRGEARPDSDIDLAAVFDRAKVKSPLVEIRLARGISDLLGVAVDLANERTLKEDVRINFDRESQLVF